MCEHRTKLSAYISTTNKQKVTVPTFSLCVCVYVSGFQINKQIKYFKNIVCFKLINQKINVVIIIYLLTLCVCYFFIYLVFVSPSFISPSYFYFGFFFLLFFFFFHYLTNDSVDL